ncbi:hypothetical protein UA08_00342 [Talaromyces atroroseus]|uniref:Uncharacterized protein n=1 Tax=Talaromyces atroroseus TaxID=1441469 RepID=A0A225BBA9_TALAT|nr:hypothetical protein UA08_00342 [Talaromyces atroroseus]OKL64706.1 hypothetical protein UA08_00342 [Talaromyces atroroseus]
MLVVLNGRIGSSYNTNWRGKQVDERFEVEIKFAASGCKLSVLAGSCALHTSRAKKRTLKAAWKRKIIAVETLVLDEGPTMP